jgi:hypothetical protein
MDFISSCGGIYQVIKDECSLSEPLVTNVPQWIICQMDIGYDIPIDLLLVISIVREV